MTTVTANVTDTVGASTAATKAVTTGSAAPLDVVRQYLQKNRPNWSSLVDVGYQGPTLTAGPIERGVVFDVQRACTLAGTRIYKAPGESSTIPVTVWNYDTQTALATQTVDWSGAPDGWFEFDFTSPVSLSTGIRYAVSFYSAVDASTFWRFNAQDFFEYPFHVIGGVPKNASGADIGGGCFLEGSHGFPYGVSAYWYWVDPRVEYTSPIATYKGGTGYFAQWPNSLDDSYFPISVFDVDAGYFADYQSIGVNLPLATNAAEARDEIVALNLDFLSSGDPRTIVSDPALAALCKGYVYADEPDMQGSGALPDTMRQSFSSLRSFDSSRPAWFGWGNAWTQGQSFGWYPNGATAAQTSSNWLATYPYTDLAACDNYSLCFGGPSAMWNYAIQVDRLVSHYENRVPASVTVETCIQVGGSHNPTVTESTRAAFLGVLHGAKMITWFDHQFPFQTADGTSYPQDFQAMLHDPDKKVGFTAFHTFLQSIKGALWAPESTNYTITVSSSNTTEAAAGGTFGVPIDVSVREDGNSIYVLAQASRMGDTTGTFTMAAASGATITVFGESRTLTANGSGTFTDTFTDCEYHVYKVPVPAAPIITTTTLSPLSAGVAFSQQLAALGAAASWTATGVPSGLTLSSGGLLSGTPSASGAYSIAVTATNGSGSNNKTYTGTIAAAPTAPVITTTSISPMSTVPLSVTLAATGTGPLTWTLDSGALPSWLTLTSDGTLSGTPSALEAYSFTIRATGPGGSDTQLLSGTVAAYSAVEHTMFGATMPYTINAYTDGDTGQFFSTQFYTTTGSPSYSTWKISGGRLYIPAGAPGGFTTTSGRMIVFKNPSAGLLTNASDYSSIASAMALDAQPHKTFATLATGWNDIRLDSPLALSPGDSFIIGFRFDSGNMYTFATGQPTTAIQAADGTRLFIVDTSGGLRGIAAHGDGSAAIAVASYYGIDAILNEG